MRDSRVARGQAALDQVVDAAVVSWPLDPILVNLTAYHLQNAYMVRYWDAIQAWRSPRDPLLNESAKRFLETLALDPTGYEALNGLGNIKFFKRDLDAAEFFHRPRSRRRREGTSRTTRRRRTSRSSSVSRAADDRSG